MILDAFHAHQPQESSYGKGRSPMLFLEQGNTTHTPTYIDPKPATSPPDIPVWRLSAAFAAKTRPLPFRSNKIAGDARRGLWPACNRRQAPMQA